MTDRYTLLRTILSHVQTAHVTLSELFCFVIVHNQFNGPDDILFKDIVQNSQQILGALYAHPATARATLDWTQEVTRAQYAGAISQLADIESGWHFSMTQANPEQVESFRIDDMAGHFERTQPALWALVVGLLGGWAQARKGSRPVQSRAGAGIVFEDDPEDDRFWEGDDELDISAIGDEGKHSSRKFERRCARRNLLIRVKSVVIINILMHSQDQRCNALQSVTGIFLHSCGAPEKLIKVLSRMGISVALSSIHRSIKSLSDFSADDVQSLGQTLLASYAFDNLDFKLPGGIPTVENPHEGLVHITTGTLLRLDHGVTLEDLRCSDLLWERSEHNPLATDPRRFNPRMTMRHLVTLHPEPEYPEGGLSRRGRFRAWFLTRTLLKHGPPSFSKLSNQLADPEAVDSIPVKKLHQRPLRAMDISVSTVSGNLEAISGLYAQGGVGDPREDTLRPIEAITDLTEYVMLVHGDLGTYEKVLSAVRRRKQERTPHSRIQSVVFVLSLFHLKMAAADAIWRILVTPEGSRTDDTSFMKLIGQLRPDDSSRLVANAKFRERHDLIAHIVTLLLLAAWGYEVQRRWGYASLEEWAETKPKLPEIQEVAEFMAGEYIEGDGMDLFAKQRRPAGERDKVQENTARTLNYLLLYEELSYAMNAGCIGRVETLFPAWIQIFRAVGKHKYANHMLRFMHALYFIYPDRLRRAIRYNILVNPTGKPHAFRAVDWIVELLNLYIKVIYGGEGANFTKKRIILESILVLVYRSSHANFERNFKLPGLTYKHAEKDMRETFRLILSNHIKKHHPHEYEAGREANYTIPYQMPRGWEILSAEWASPHGAEIGAGGEEEAEGAGEEASGEEAAEELTADDVSAEGML